MTLPKPCADCGTPTSGATYCDEHAPKDTRRRPSRSIGYDWRWNKLADRAKKLQPWCSICGVDTPLDFDHSPRGWARVDAGLPLRLCDGTVLCHRHNVSAGSSRQGSARFRQWQQDDGDLRADTPDATLTTWGDTPPAPLPKSAGQAESRSHTPGGY